MASQKLLWNISQRKNTYTNLIIFIEDSAYLSDVSESIWSMVALDHGKEDTPPCYIG